MTSTYLRPLILALCLLSGCHDLSLPPPPPPPGPGLIAGRLVWNRPGRLLREPAAGARVFLLGTNLAVQADDDGRFLLAGLTSNEGTLLARFDSDADGEIDRQRAFSLEQLGAGLGVQLSLGDVLLGRSAVLAGKLLREDLPGPTGHSGTPVFVLGAPFVTTTGDDGSFVFEALPEGPARIGALRDGYLPFESGELALRSGESAALALATLSPTSEVTSVRVHGRVLDGSGQGLGAVTITLSDTASTTSDGTGAYEFTAVHAGRFDVGFARAGAQSAALYNVVVFGSASISLPDVTLTGGTGTPSLVGELGVMLDAGTPPDAGSNGDAGLDGGAITDGGGADAGGGSDAGSTGLCSGADGGAPLAFVDVPALLGYGDEVVFSAGRSIDPDCLPLRYRWSVVDGGPVPAFADNDSFTATQQRFTAAAFPTDYVLQVVVTDDQGLTGTASGQVRITPRPLVDAGVDFPVSLVGRTVTLDASGSVDPLNRALSFTWRMLSGPGQLLATNTAVVPMQLTMVGVAVAEVKVCYLPQHCSLGTVSVQAIATNQLTVDLRPATQPIPATLGVPVALTAQATTTTNQDPVTFAWLAPDGNLSFSGGGGGSTTDVTGLSVGDYRVRLQGTAGLSSTFIDRVVRVAPPPLSVVDAGVSALSMWMTVSPQVDPMSINATTVSLLRTGTDAGVPFSVRYDGVNDRIVALFTTPQVDQPLTMSLVGATVAAAPVGPAVLARTTPQLRFVDTVPDLAIALSSQDLTVGLAYCPRGPVAFGRYKGGTGMCAVNPCLTAFGTRTAETAELNFVTTATAATLPMRRAVHAGATIYAFSDSSGVVRNEATTITYTGPFTPPGPIFSDAFTLWSIGWTSTTPASVTTWTGSAWSGSDATTSVATALWPLRAAGAAAGATRYVLVIHDDDKAYVHTGGLTGPFSAIATSVASNVTQGRIAATPSGPVVALRDTNNGLTLYRFTGTSWVSQSIAASGITGFDLVAREGTLFLAYSSGTTLTVQSIDPSNLVARVTVGPPDGGTSFGTLQATAVGELELSANDFGDLALAWSENQGGGWRLLVSELR